MTRMQKLPSDTKLSIIMVALALALAACLAFVTLGVASGRIPPEQRWLWGALPALPILGMHYVAFYILWRADEFIRTLVAKRLTIATLVFLSAVTVYGFVQFYAKWPAPPILFLAPAFWITFSIVCLFVTTSRASAK